jgi:uncharacterized protein
MHDSIKTVQTIYDAFGRGDIPAILEQLAEDVRWEAWSDNHAQAADVPWLRPLVGREAVLQFFGVVGGFQFHDFQVRSLMAGGNQVAADLLVDATVPSGVRMQDEEMHLWTLDDSGKVSRFRHYVDTAKHIAAARG